MYQPDESLCVRIGLDSFIHSVIYLQTALDETGHFCPYLKLENAAAFLSNINDTSVNTQSHPLVSSHVPLSLFLMVAFPAWRQLLPSGLVTDGGTPAHANEYKDANKLFFARTLMCPSIYLTVEPE